VICLAPRALNVRPLRPAGVVARPLNFTVRGHECATTMTSLSMWATWSLSM
jgi:hypothetical protein